MGIRLSEIIRHYSRKDIGAELVRFARNREIAVKYKEGFGKRPDILQFPGDIINLVRKGAVSFHASEERWQDPLKLSAESTKPQLDNLRTGWDLVLDIDCDILEWSNVCAQLLLEALRYHDLKCASIKFSGGSGWHIGIPHEALVASKSMPAFPDTPQTIARYLKEFIAPHLADRILELEKDIKNISRKSGKKPKELIKNKEFNPYSILEIDTVLISSRHLIRMPYSLHEKTWLVSLPINPKSLMQFNTNWAKPEAITEVKDDFLNPEKAKPGEGSQLLIQALDWKIREIQKEAKTYAPKFEFKGKVPKEVFPPCIKCILEGLPDGRKRSVFVLCNFLISLGWSWDEIEKEIRAWNLKNAQPLKAGYLNSQLRWRARQALKIPPPNCKEYYQDFGVCKPDNLCRKIKNPLSYVRIKTRKQV